MAMAKKEQKNIKQDRMISAKDIINKYDISYQAVNHYTDFGLLSVWVKRECEILQ